MASLFFFRKTLKVPSIMGRKGNNLEDITSIHYQEKKYAFS